jgi:signal transduction histidine kinase
MPSPKTDPDRSRPARRLDLAGGASAFWQRLNTRMVLAIASVALISLLISALAISQILPGYFRQQAVERLETAALSVALVTQEFAESARADNPNYPVVPELRQVFIYDPAVELAAGALIPATVAIYNESGQLEARAQPDAADLRAEGLRLDPEVPRYETRIVRLQVTEAGESVGFRVFISDAYTTREATLAQIRSALIGAGLLALLAALVLGVLAARRVTAPISRLRRVAGTVAAGELDERATASGVREVDELAAQFNVMADQLAGTLRVLEADRDRLREFVADVSHELRTPISALRMYTDLQRDGEVDEPTRREFLDRSAEQIRRLEWLSTNLLDLSRIDAGIFPLDMRPGDLRDPIRAVVEAQAEVAERRDISLGSEVPATPVTMRFDRERIVQLLTNLVGNALKFTPSGGVVSLKLTESAGIVVIEVRDTGAGIPPDELPRIFDRFYRGTNIGEARASGSGLGLAIVRSIVEMHGGTIDVQSVVGEGTVFRIELPRAGAQQSSAAEPSAGPAALED